MSVSAIPPDIRCRLWGRAAGRCQYAGCNIPLWRDDLTQHEFNSSYIAHIVADQPNGPRGDQALSVALSKDLGNLMLLCDAHHRLVDKADVPGHSVERLSQMKVDHEARIELLTSLQADRQSEVVLYGANIGNHASPLHFTRCVEAMTPRYYPATPTGTSLGMKDSANKDKASIYWKAEEAHLRSQFVDRIKTRLASGSLAHLSVFALAPQPLLILLGHLLGDLPSCEIYQKHREPDSWAWQPELEHNDFVLDVPKTFAGEPALILSISATVHNERVRSVLSGVESIWKIRIPRPHNDAIRSSVQLQAFRQIARQTLDRIKAAHGQNTLLHLFPAAPNSVAVEFGRLHMPKADLPCRIYDQNAELGGFVHALDLGICSDPPK